jgi:hypothetical protein
METIGTSIPWRARTPLFEASRQGAAVVVAFSPDNKTVLVAGLGFLSTWDIARVTACPRDGVPPAIVCSRQT